MESDEELSYNTYLSRKLNRYGKYYPKDKKLPSTDDSEETSKSKKTKKIDNNSKKSQNYNDFDNYSVFNYVYKNKCRLDLKKLSLTKSKINIPTPTISKKSSKKADNDKNNNNTTNSSDYNKGKTYAYIKRFPTNSDHLVFIKDKIYNIYNIKTGEKIRSQKTNDIAGYQGVIPLPRERIFTVGGDFLRIYHYNLYKKELKFVEPNCNYPNYEITIYVRQITSNYVVICKKTVCYLYNLQKYCSDKIIYLKSIIKLLNNKKSFRGITKTDFLEDNDIFSNCKIFSKREFGLCYNNFIFLVSVPEGSIITYFDVSISNLLSSFENSKKCIKRMNIIINTKKEMKKYYLVWNENSNLIKLFAKNDKKIDVNDKFIIPSNNNSETQERHNLIVFNNKEELISFEKDVHILDDKIIFNIKQCSNSDIVIITKNNEMLIYNFLAGAIITMINFAQIILEHNLYFLKRIGKGLFLVNLINGMLGLIELKTGKILKKFNVDENFCNYIDILNKDDENKNKLNKNILILNLYNIYNLDI